MGISQRARAKSREAAAERRAERDVEVVEDVTEPAPAEPFDPAEHTVHDVLVYVEAHPDEAAAVLEAERAGKARKGIIDALS